MAANVKALLSGFEFEKQMYMTKEQLSNMACEAYNSLGMNPPHYHWMDGFVAGYLAHQQNLQQCNVSGSLPLADILTMLTNAHEELAKSKISMDDYTPISSDLASAKSKLYKLI